MHVASLGSTLARCALVAVRKCRLVWRNKRFESNAKRCDLATCAQDAQQDVQTLSNVVLSDDGLLHGVQIDVSVIVLQYSAAEDVQGVLCVLGIGCNALAVRWWVSMSVVDSLALVKSQKVIFLAPVGMDEDADDDEVALEIEVAFVVLSACRHHRHHLLLQMRRLME